MTLGLSAAGALFSGLCLAFTFGCLVFTLVGKISTLAPEPRLSASAIFFVRNTWVEGLYFCIFVVTSSVVSIRVGMTIAGAGAVALAVAGEYTSRRKEKCNCFGVFSNLFDPWATRVRIGLISAGACIFLVTNFANIKDWNAVAVGYAMGSLACLYFVTRRWALYIRQSQLVRSRKFIVNEVTSISNDLPLGINSSGVSVTLKDYVAKSKLVLIVYLSEGCKRCRAIADTLQRNSYPQSDVCSIVVVSSAAIDFLPDVYGEVPIDSSKFFYTQVGALGTPFGLLVDTGTGSVVRPIAYGENGLMELLASRFPSGSNASVTSV